MIGRTYWSHGVTVWPAPSKHAALGGPAEVPGATAGSVWFDGCPGPIQVSLLEIVPAAPPSRGHSF